MHNICVWSVWSYQATKNSRFSAALSCQARLSHKEENDSDRQEGGKILISENKLSERRGHGTAAFSSNPTLTLLWNGYRKLSK